MTTIRVTPGVDTSESTSFGEMLLRMYQRRAERHGLVNVRTRRNVLVVTGDEAAPLYAAETGVHRLVRISPFDKQKRRHTSFARVRVNRERRREEVVRRSYVFEPYKQVRDHIDRWTREDVAAVLDGEWF